MPGAWNCWNLPGPLKNCWLPAHAFVSLTTGRGSEQVYEAIIRTHFAGRTLGLEIPALNRALLLIELEPGEEDTHCGFWLSTVGLDQADSVETAFKNHLKQLK